MGDDYAARAARGCKTLLHDCLTHCRDELDQIRDEVVAAMDAVPPTTAPPGSPEKVEELAARFARGDSLFVERDAAL